MAKKKRIDLSASRAQLGNPGTRSGLYASEAVRKRCREVEEASEEAKKAKRLAEERSAEKKAERAQREKSAFKDVVGKVTRGELKVTEEGLQKLTATHMRDCLRGMGEPTPSNTRKGELVAALLPWLLLTKAAAEGEVKHIESSSA